MIGVALKGLAGRKIRALLTAFAVVIGVSMVSGTFILTDTMQQSFNGLFEESSSKTDAVVRGKEIVKDSFSGSGVTIPESILTKIRALPEVEAAGGEVGPQEANTADIIGKDGKAVMRESSGGSYDPANGRFSPLELKTGEWAEGPKQVVIDAGTAKKEHLEVGDPVKIATGGKTNTYELAGTATFGGVDSLGFASIAAWDVKTAQTLLGREGRFDSMAAADTGAHERALAHLRCSVELAERAGSRQQASFSLSFIGRSHSYVRNSLMPGRHSSARLPMPARPSGSPSNPGRNPGLPRPIWRPASCPPAASASSTPGRWRPSSVTPAGREPQARVSAGSPAWTARSPPACACSRRRGGALGASPTPTYGSRRMPSRELAAIAVAAEHRRARGWVEDLISLTARTGMRELAVRAYLLRADLGDPSALDSAAILVAEVENRALRGRIHGLRAAVAA